MARRKDEEEKFNEVEFEKRRKTAALKILRHWRNYKKGTQFSFAKVAFLKSSELGKTSGTERRSEKISCGICKKKLAVRLCVQCPDSETN